MSQNSESNFEECSIAPDELYDKDMSIKRSKLSHVSPTQTMPLK